MKAEMEDARCGKGIKKTIAIAIAIEEGKRLIAGEVHCAP